MSTANDMKRLFAEWPAELSRQGLIIASFGEAIPFVSYMLSGELILLERKTPDASGARRVIMPLDRIQAVKILDAIEMPRFAAMGFESPPEPAQARPVVQSRPQPQTPARTAPAPQRSGEFPFVERRRTPTS